MSEQQPQEESKPQEVPSSASDSVKAGHMIDHPLYGLSLEEAKEKIKEKGDYIIKVYRLGDVVYDIFYDRGVTLYTDENDKVVRIEFSKNRGK